MDTKLTLRLEEQLIEKAKKEARKRGTSVSKMVAEYFRSLHAMSRDKEAYKSDLPPKTASLLGVLKGKNLERSTYRKHLEKKYR